MWGKKDHIRKYAINQASIKHEKAINKYIILKTIKDWGEAITSRHVLHMRVSGYMTREHFNFILSYIYQMYICRAKAKTYKYMNTFSR